MHTHNEHESKGHMLDFISPLFLDEQRPVFVFPTTNINILQSAVSLAVTQSGGLLINHNYETPIMLCSGRSTTPPLFLTTVSTD